MLTKLFNRLLEQDFASIDFNALGSEAFSDFHRGYRTEQLAFFACFMHKSTLNSLNPGLNVSSFLAQLLRLAIQLALVMLKFFELSLTRLNGHPLRDQVITTVTRLDIDHFTNGPEIFNIFSQNDIHLFILPKSL